MKKRSAFLVAYMCVIWVFSVCQNPIIDSKISDTTGMAAAMRQMAEKHKVSSEMLSRLYQSVVPVEVKYISYDGKLHTGVLVVNKALKNEIVAIFNLMLADSFPVYKVVPANAFPLTSDLNGWNDERIMSANVTSCFNMRIKTHGKTWSAHAYGRAIDINPAQNPYIKSDSKTYPKGSVYNTAVRGTITIKNIVRYFCRFGWQWGGRWRSVKDYQHFEKK